MSDSQVREEVDWVRLETYMMVTILSYIVKVLQVINTSVSPVCLQYVLTLCFPPARIHYKQSAYPSNFAGTTEQSTFCVSTALFSCAISSVFPTVPRKIGLNWFMPALVKRSVGSLWGTTEDEGTEKLAKECLREPSPTRRQSFQSPIELPQAIEVLPETFCFTRKRRPRHLPTVWPFPSKNSRKVFLTTGAVHFSCLLVILKADVRKSRYIAGLVVVRVLKTDRVGSVL